LHNLVALLCCATSTNCCEWRWFMHNICLSLQRKLLPATTRCSIWIHWITGMGQARGIGYQHWIKFSHQQ